MPGRDPEARKRSKAVADAVRAEMAKQNLTGAALRAKLTEKGIQIPNDMWLSRRMNGDVNLVEPVKVVYGATDDLKAIAEVLKVDPDRWVRTINSKTRTNDTAAV